jgi:acyl-CoA reductase-like NAD-dependent aldehyde dehydrogenase
MIEVEQVAEAIASPHVHAVTLTGSEAAGARSRRAPDSI